jgi:malate dehydrogenase
VVLLDVVPGLPQGKALDILESAPLIGFNSSITGSNSYQDTAGSDVVVIASGSGRKPGTSRDELLKTNAQIVSQVTRSVIKHSPDCILIMVTNPVDAMTYLALKTSGFPSRRVLGLSGVLDGARFCSFIATELNVPVEDVSAYVLGEHGSNMVVIPRLAEVGGKPITRLLPSEAINRLVERTVNGGAEIVGLLQTGSAFYAPSAAAARMVEAIIQDEKRVLPCAVHLDGEYGVRDAVIGVPVKLGKGGVEEVVEFELTDEEKAALAKSAEAVRRTIGKLGL